MWEIEYTDEFGRWWDTLDEPAHVSVASVVNLLQQMGSQLRHPYSSAINGAKTTHMRELRIQHKGQPYRILYAFDPKRNAILLIGGNKKGDDRWYEKFVPLADSLYEKHLEQLKAEEK